MFACLKLGSSVDVARARVRVKVYLGIMTVWTSATTSEQRVRSWLGMGWMA